MTTTDEVNLYLNGSKINLNYFKELCSALNLCKKFNVNAEKTRAIFLWFRFLQNNEIPGWRTKKSTEKIIKILINNEKSRPLQFYALFCPSYKKGKEVLGFRVDGVGETTQNGIKNLVKFYDYARNLGFICEKPLAIFFDLAVERYDDIIKNDGLKDLETNISNFVSILPKEADFIKLSDMSSELKNSIGYSGVKIGDILVPDEVYKRVVKRGGKFYQHFNWSNEQIIERSMVVVRSEAMVGAYLSNRFKYGITIYTPTMLERSAVYSGLMIHTDPLPIIFPVNRS